MRYTAEQIKTLIKSNRLDIFYNSYEWRKISAEVKALHNNECYICKQKGKYSKAVIVHHVKHLRQYPELAYSRVYQDCDGSLHDQLVPVCIECHNTIHGYSHSAYINKERW